MVDKKGFMRVVEATIAVLLVIGVLLIISSQREINVERDLSGVLPGILDEIAHNSSLRNETITENPGALIKINNFVEARLDNRALNYSIKICDLNQACELDVPANTKRDIYVSERVISAILTEANFNPKKIKIFLWRK